MISSVLMPLGMTQSTVRPAEATKRPHATGYRADGQNLVAAPLSNDTRIWPAGYLWTNAADMSHALAALMSQGRVKDQPGLPASAD